MKPSQKKALHQVIRHTDEWCPLRVISIPSTRPLVSRVTLDVGLRFANAQRTRLN